MTCRGVRGATTVVANTASEIYAATRELLTAIIVANGIAPEDVGSVIFTATADLDAAYPAVVARELGWGQAPLLCMQEMCVTGSLPRCIRVLLHWNTDKAPGDIAHVYLREAVRLRPDLVQRAPGSHHDASPGVAGRATAGRATEVQG